MLALLPSKSQKLNGSLRLGAAFYMSEGLAELLGFSQALNLHCEDNGALCSCKFSAAWINKVGSTLYDYNIIS